ncbi:MAG: hypothetical protein PW844_18135 [Pantoea sp.]|uniref:hypothetical protein n=1 Tax=Pantoea sp. TaxID=69393 RepID=UPI0023A56C5E|nr:hypothetical protein [Pantoea sp.]MDE1188382.1 hypothetical protein [Pantoea sp.]
MLEPEEGLLTFRAEGNNVKSSRNYSRVIHWPGNLSLCRKQLSGVTLGRGFDLGDRSTISVLNTLIKAGIKKEQAELISEGAKLKGCAAYDFVQKNKERIGEISERQQVDLFNMAYVELKRDVERICKKKDILIKYHPRPDTPPDVAWNNIPGKIKDILIDLRYRGDYKEYARELLQPMAYAGDLIGFGKALSDRSLWAGVPIDRFNKRVEYYERY